MRFNYKYFIATIFLFIVEVLIATKLAYIDWLRAYFGDVLVVILIYTFIQTFFKIDKTKTIIGVFLFACAIEFAQHFHFAELLGFKDNKIAMIFLGNSFSWIDILCYVFGCILVLLTSVINICWRK
jgi:hypothetical protein